MLTCLIVQKSARARVPGIVLSLRSELTSVIESGAPTRPKWIALHCADTQIGEGSALWVAHSISSHPVNPVNAILAASPGQRPSHLTWLTDPTEKQAREVLP